MATGPFPHPRVVPAPPPGPLREVTRRDVLSQVVGLRDVDQQVSDQVDELLLRPCDVLTLIQERPEFLAVVLALVADERVGLEDSFEPPGCVAALFRVCSLGRAIALGA